eukprot:Skav229043  [mRNA]  locus=scaffold2828:38139:43017:+ [translate_table: standard]
MPCATFFSSWSCPRWIRVRWVIPAPKRRAFSGARRVTELWLFSLNLTWLPESVGRLRALQSLRLSHNRLKALPESLKQTDLRDLYVNNNQLTQVPSAISSLQNLVRLDLSYNQLAALPPWLGNLGKLNRLYLQVNRIVSLPESIQQLLSLSVLMLNDNRLSQLPESIGQMRSLQTLEIKGNGLRSLPQLTGLQWLYYLDLSFNQLETLPPLEGLKGLYYLFLQKNQLTKLPDSIGALEKLIDLNLRSNRLTRLPESILNLKWLNFLTLDNNQLTALPASFGNFTDLRFLSLTSNRLQSLPDSFGTLKLATLHLDGNRLTSIPRLRENELIVEIRASRNQLTTFPVDNMPNLQVLSLHNNQLETLSKDNINVTFPSLQVALLHSNRLSDPLEICKLGGNHLQTLYLHGNRLKGEIPSCFSHFQGLEVLTLHRNALYGLVPGQILRNLNVLTLHENRLQGKLPEELTTAPKLLLFSAHSNRLVGSIPAFKLLKDCVDDESFVKGQLSCRDHPYAGIGCDPHSDVAVHCPETCGFCSNASARGPVLLLHNNRLSCGLPEKVTSWPQNVRSISLVGNMLGNGSSQVPQWIQRHERQPFLYVSDDRATSTLKRGSLLAVAFAACWLLLFSKNGRQILSSKCSELTRKMHIFLFQLGTALTVLAAFLLAFYAANATYYECSSSFSSATLSNFSNPDSEHGHVGEWMVAILWASWVAVGAFSLRYAPGRRDTEEAMEEAMEEAQAAQVIGLARVIYSFCWLCIVALLSLPSIVYALVGNSVLPQVLHVQAGPEALVMVLVDMFITPRVVKIFSEATGMRRSMLLMAARLGTMWLAGVVCDESTEDYQLFNISLGDHPLLEPLADLCSAKESWWSDSACARSVVDTMAPLLVSKMITRAFLQPIILLIRHSGWQLSYLKDGQLYMLRGALCTSRSLERGQQASLLVTWAEIALLWGALVPVLLPIVLLATGTNMLMCKVGHGHFGVSQVTRDRTAAGMSRRYLHGSLSVLLAFQNWFAWTSGMHGRWLLLITAFLYLLELLRVFGCQKCRNRVAVLNEAPSTEMSCR